MYLLIVKVLSYGIYSLIFKQLGLRVVFAHLRGRLREKEQAREWENERGGEEISRNILLYCFKRKVNCSVSWGYLKQKCPWNKTAAEVNFAVEYRKVFDELLISVKEGAFMFCQLPILTSKEGKHTETHGLPGNWTKLGRLHLFLGTWYSNENRNISLLLPLPGH